jgi:hypothetical protein
MATISAKGVWWRFLIALALVLFTWNPTRYNYVEWAAAQWSNQPPLVAFVGVVFLIAWIFFGRATARSLGVFGIVLAIGLAACLLWILLYYNFISMQSRTIIEWIVLVLLSAILAAGMSWSHLRKSWSGQTDVDERDVR